MDAPFRVEQHKPVVLFRSTSTLALPCTLGLASFVDMKEQKASQGTRSQQELLNLLLPRSKSVTSAWKV